MKAERFTSIAQQVLSDAQRDAMGRSHPEITGLHLLAALLEDQSGPARSIMAKAGADANRAASITAGELSRLPTVSSGLKRFSTLGALMAAKKSRQPGRFSKLRWAPLFR